MKQPAINLVVFVLVVLNSDNALAKCRRRTKYDFITKSCVECDTCKGAGAFMNQTVRLQRDKVHGFLECFPCESCPENTFRTSNDPIDSCLPCVLDCKALNRLESQQCGSGTEGHCGECILGYHPETKEPNDRCIQDSTQKPPVPGDAVVREKTVVPLGPITVALSPTKLPVQGDSKNNIENRNANTPHKAPDVESDNKKRGLELYEVLIICFVIVACLLAVTYGAWHLRNSCCNTEVNSYPRIPLKPEVNLAKAGDSGISVGYLPKTGRNGSFKNSPETKELLSDSGFSNFTVDTEIDGPRSDVRGEAPISMTIEELQALGQKTTGSIKAQQKEIPSICLDRSDQFTKECLTFVSKHVFGEHVESFFDYLDLKKPVFIPHKDIWHAGKNNHDEYVYKVLQEWLKQNGRAANLQKLCNALDLAGFDEVVDSLFSEVIKKSASDTGNAHTMESLKAASRSVQIDIEHNPTWHSLSDIEDSIV